MKNNDVEVLSKIKSFLDGHNEFEHVVNVEAYYGSNEVDLIIQEPDNTLKIKKHKFTPFMFVKDFEKLGYKLYEENSNQMIVSKRLKYGITITKLKTGNQKRLEIGYVYKYESKNSFNDLIQYFKDGGLDPYTKALDIDGEVIRDEKGRMIYHYRDLFYYPKLNEQFFISTGIRLFKGYEEYDNIHRMTFDIETTGLRYERSRIFAIGVRDNKGFEMVLEVDGMDDDISEKQLIEDFFNIIEYLRPSVISGYNSENFDFDFILGRAKILKLKIKDMKTSLKEGVSLKRKGNVSVKYGNTSEKYTATEMWGYSVIDIMHAAKKTAAINTELKSVKLKEVAKFENIAKSDRTYIAGDVIGRYYTENRVFILDSTDNSYFGIPDEHQEVAKRIIELQNQQNDLSQDEYFKLKKEILITDKEFVIWYRKQLEDKKYDKFITGRDLVNQYLLDDLWETEQIDSLYGQSSFMLAKIVPTVFQRVCIMGTASIWNLLMTTWSYENNIAIPVPDVKVKFTGGLSRCFKNGYTERMIKIDYASLYPFIQLSHGVFPMFDITGVIKEMLLYLTTTRNIYKKVANGTDLKDEEKILLKQIDHDIYNKLVSDNITKKDKSNAKVKQLPIKTLNNSLFGALGSDISFNWSDNISAERITVTGRIYLRQAIKYFENFGCIPLYCVTDGVNFQYPEKTTIKVDNNNVYYDQEERDVDDMWKYGKAIGVSALIEKFNVEGLKSQHMSVDDDGRSISCLNLKRINYGTYKKVKDKDGNEVDKITLTGNMIKSKVMPQYIEEFFNKALLLIMQGKGKEFVDYYYDYCDDIRYMQVPIKKIANKSKVKTTIKNYLNRGTDINGRDKSVQAHMELIIRERNALCEQLFEEHKDKLTLPKNKKVENLKIVDKMKAVSDYMPPEPELDTYVYYVNIGTRKSHGDSKMLKNKENGDEYIASRLLTEEEVENQDKSGKYNYEKYLANFNNKVKTLIVGFDEAVQKTLLVKINKKGELVKEMFTHEQLALRNFDFDNIDESMHLSPNEVKYWNNYGYDPRKIWNGFKVYEGNEVYYEIYEHALNHLNTMLKESGSNKIVKAVDDEYIKGDMVLIKNKKIYDIGLFNGTYIEIIREDVKIPKSELQLKLDKEHDEKLEKLKTQYSMEEFSNEEFEKLLEKRESFFGLFKETFNVKAVRNLSFTDFISNTDLVEMLDQFIKTEEKKIEEENLVYNDWD